MSSDIILSVENVSKLYQLGTVGTGTFGGDVQRFWKTKILRQEDPFLKIGQTNDRTSKKKAEFVWALRDINFEVRQGDVLGIIGKNGAGKSTLLKLLSRITTPTTGSIKSAGRMASLLEVGTGFHPELTGRENVFLNGAILGMSKREIKSKFDEIVDFSGCELYIDTPTKRYSSGMKVRLGFAVAAFLDPEILIVDEVLAVGDAEFQKKAIGKMKDISEGNRRTVLFVSHNLNSISELCTTGIVLENGLIKFTGSSENAVSYYSSNVYSKSDFKDYIRSGSNSLELQINSAIFCDPETHSNKYLFSADEQVCLKLTINKNSTIKGSYLHLIIEDEKGNCVVETDSFEHGVNYLDNKEIGQIIIDFIFPQRIFKTGKYFVSVGIASKQAVKFQIESLSQFIGFEVVADKYIRDSSRISITSVIPKVKSEFIYDSLRTNHLIK